MKSIHQILFSSKHAVTLSIIILSLFLAHFFLPFFSQSSSNSPLQNSALFFPSLFHALAGKKNEIFKKIKRIHLVLPPNLAVGTGITMGSCFGKHSTSDNNVSKEVEVARCAGPVVVELFSSLGDANSPEAEMLFSSLGRGDFKLEMPVILLAYHVDYWNHMGWKDPFGSSLWTDRQKAYNQALQIDDLYTPQAVFQGKAQCMASMEDKLLSRITAAPRYPGLEFQATFRRPAEDSLQVTLTGHLNWDVDSHGVDINVALYENGLVTDVENGPNIGRVLTTDYVVRKLEKLSSVENISAETPVSETLKFTLWEGFDSGKCGIAVFLQNDSHHIFGSQDIKLPKDLEVKDEDEEEEEQD